MVTGSRKLHFRQFHWPTRLVFIVLPILGVSWCAVAACGVWQQRMAIAQVEKLGGTVYYDVNVSELSGTSHFLRRLFGIDLVANVGSVDLWGPGVTDTDIECVKAFVHLESISLAGTSISDSGLRHLRGFRSLRRLDLWTTNIGDEGVRQLQGLASLRILKLGKTKITDSGLKHLKGLTALNELYLDETQVTDAGVGELRKSLPTCKVYR